MKLISLFLFSFLFIHSLFAQDSLTVESIKRQYESFQFNSVIVLSEKMLSKKDSLSSNNLIAIYTLKGIAQYSLGLETEAKKSFEEILKLRNDYALDPVSTSPKIISFFEKVRNDFPPASQTISHYEISKKDSLVQPLTVYIHENNDSLTQAFVRSIIIPGWGHIYENNSTTGYILSGVSIANIGLLSYYIFDTNKKEKGYLNETNSLLISEKYSQYNSSYQTRNILLGSYLVLWLYSQIDILTTDTKNRKEFSLLINPSPTFPRLNFGYVIR